MPTRRPAVTAVAVPQDAQVRRFLERVDYFDAYRIELPESSNQDVEVLLRRLFQSTPGWIRTLMAIRNRAVGVLGLKTGQIDLFPILNKAPNEVILGEDDKHLNFRVSLCVSAVDGRSAAVLTTVVQFKSLLGRAYFLPVKPIHKQIVQAMLRSLCT